MGMLSEYDDVALQAMNLSSAADAFTRLGNTMRQILDESDKFLAGQSPLTVQIAYLRLQVRGNRWPSSLEIAAEIEEMRR